jgi:hypothetical protein
VSGLCFFPLPSAGTQYHKVLQGKSAPLSQVRVRYSDTQDSEYKRLDDVWVQFSEPPLHLYHPVEVIEYLDSEIWTKRICTDRSAILNIVRRTMVEDRYYRFLAPSYQLQ